MPEHHQTPHSEDSHKHIHPGPATKNLKLAFFLNLFFTLIEIGGGFLTNSIAILSDALHDLGDTLSIGLSWYFQKLSSKSRDLKYSYGYKRLSLVGALISAIILLMGSIFIIYEAIPRLLNPPAIYVKGMFAIAVLGVIVNGIAVLKLREGHLPSERVIRLHLLEDVLGWLAVLLGSMLMYFFDWPMVDSILSMAIASYILWNALKNIAEFVHLFLQGIPRQIDIHTVGNEIEKISDVLSVHDIHIWSMDGEYNILSAHLVVEDDLTSQRIIKIKKVAKQILRKYKIKHDTLEFEYKSEACQFEDC